MFQKKRDLANKSRIEGPLAKKAGKHKGQLSKDMGSGAPRQSGLRESVPLNRTKPAGFPAAQYKRLSHTSGSPRFPRLDRRLWSVPTPPNPRKLGDTSQASLQGS